MCAPQTPEGWTREGRADPAFDEDLAEGLRRALRAGARIKDEEETLLLRRPEREGATWWKLTRVPARRRLGTLLTRSRALREWSALQAMRTRGVGVVEAPAWAELRRAGLLRASLLVTREEPGGRDLRARFGDALDPTARRAWIEEAGRAARRMHDAGFGHFRLQLRNLLGTESSGGRRVFVLDAPYACMFAGPAPARIRQLDLVDLAGSGSALDDREAGWLLEAYADGQARPCDLATLRGRSGRTQKLRRIVLYLFYQNLGRRPIPDA